MKAVIGDYQTNIYLSGDEFKEYCKPGEGENTCIWALVGANGFECCYYNRPYPLVKRWRDGFTVAKRDGCGKVIEFDPSGKFGEVEF